MKGKAFLVAVMAAVAAVAFTGCSLFEDMGRSHHEGNSTMLVVENPFDKLPAAEKTACKNAGYNVNTVKETPSEAEFEADGLDITLKKIDDKKSKLYIRSGNFGEKDKEALIVNEIKKELGIK